jgi:hypothetical protein
MGYGNLEKVYFKYPEVWWDAGNFSFLAPEYDPSNTSRQNIEVLSLAHFGNEDDRPILLFFVYNPLSTWLSKSPSRREITDFFMPYIQRIPVRLVLLTSPYLIYITGL